MPVSMHGTASQKAREILCETPWIAGSELCQGFYDHFEENNARKASRTVKLADALHVRPARKSCKLPVIVS